MEYRNDRVVYGISGTRVMSVLNDTCFGGILSSEVITDMSKKHFIAAGVLKESNPRFKRERWVGYVNGTSGPNGGPKK